MTKLIAKADYCYGGRRLKAGDSFEASEKDARLLTLVQKATPAEAEQPKPKAKKKAPPKGYARRDMRATA